MSGRRVGWTIVAVLTALGALLFRAQRAERHEFRPAAVVQGASRAPARRAVASVSVLSVLTGKVVTLEGKPIPGAAVCLRCRAGECVTLALLTCIRAEKTGAFRFDGVVAGSYDVSASASGYRATAAPSTLTLQPKAELREVVLTLTEGGVPIRGTVLDASGGPIAGATVTAGAPDDPRVAATWSETDGRFELAVEAGAGVLRASADGYASSGRPYSAPGTGLDITLMSASSLSGRVVDAAGTPIPGVPVVAHQLAQFAVDVAQAESDESGAFRLEGLSTGPYELTARGHKWATAAAVRRAVGVAENVEDVVLVVTRARTLSGIVLLGRNACSAGKGRVRLRGADSRSATTGDGGKVRFDDVLPGSYDVVADCRGGRRAVEHLVVGDDDVLDREWRLTVGGTVRGTVRTAERKAAPNVTVNVGGQRDPSSTSCVSGEKGDFECLGLPPGTYDCYATAAGKVSSNTIAVVVVEGADPAPVELLLRPIGTLEITVTDPSDGPLDGVPPTVEDATHTPFPSRKMGGGRFMLPALLPGRYRVSLGHGGPKETSRSIDVRSGDNFLRLRHDAPRAELHGKVSDERGMGVPDVVVTLRNEAFGAESYVAPVLSGPDGAFRFGSLMEGTYTVTAEHASLGTATARGAHTGIPVDVRLAAPASASGVVKTASGEPIDDFLLEYFGADTGTGRRFRGSGGQWTLDSLRPGVWTLRATTHNGVGTQQLSLEPGQRASGIEIQIADAPRAPATGVPL